jgi:hypothetical protein
MNPKVKKRGDLWEVTFRKDGFGFASIVFASWDRALEAACRGRNKNPLDAVWDERFLLNADRALQKMVNERAFN